MITAKHRRRRMKRATEAEATSSFGRARVMRVVAVILMGGAVGTATAIGWGSNYRARVERVDGLGTFYRLPLADDIRELNDIRDAQMATPGASDFERMSINNYWLSSDEKPERLLNFPEWDDTKKKSAEAIESKYAVFRNHDGVKRGALLQLRTGRNFFVFEMEDNYSGEFCAGGFQIFVNDETLRGIPYGGPSRDEILSLIGAPVRGEKDTETKGFPGVLCSRRIIEIDVGLEPEPFTRFQEVIDAAVTHLGLAHHNNDVE